jgi:drug/metabolite transporter (DMT)-like permease
MWGLVFAGPLLLPDYPAAALAFGRYLAFGLVAVALARLDWARLTELTRADWLEALKLGLIGNILYYLFLASAIQASGGALPTMIIGTLPVVIAVVSNRRDAARDGRLPWRRLLPSLLLIGAGLALVNQAELDRLRGDPAADLTRYALGAALAVGAVACWTWYPIRNADWLRTHTDRSPRAWATAQGLATLPLAALGYAGLCLWAGVFGSAGADGGVGGGIGSFEVPLGPRPWAFIGLMFAIAIFASWLGTLCWNAASQRLPTTLVGQLIVFETLAALVYVFMLRQQWPPLPTAIGIGLLVAGVATALRQRPVSG